jgi:hypothetical protein
MSTREFKPAEAFHIVCNNSNHHGDVHLQLITNHLSCCESHLPPKYFIPYGVNIVFWPSGGMQQDLQHVAYIQGPT